MNKKLSDTIDRLAALYEYGELLVSTDPASLIAEACDEIERGRKQKARADAKAGQ